MYPGHFSSYIRPTPTHYDPESRIRGIRRKNQNDIMDKNTYKYCWGHPGLLGNIWH